MIARRIAWAARLAALIAGLAAGLALAGEAIATPGLAAAPLDAGHAELAAVLRGRATPAGFDYASLRRDRAALHRYQVQLATAAEPADRGARLAFWINAYNAMTLALVVDRLPADEDAWPTWSIRNLGGPVVSAWQRYDFAVAGRRVSLDDIEHRILRPLGEPRIHVALNCASRSCPALAGAPYLEATLEVQLDAVARAFAADANQVRWSAGQLAVNPILLWFAEDFLPGGAADFLRRHLPPGPAADHLAAGRPITYFAYDWSLNLAPVGDLGGSRGDR